MTDDDDDEPYERRTTSPTSASGPNPKGNRPRTKQRPDHEDAVSGPRARRRPRPHARCSSTRTAPTSAPCSPTRASELGKAGRRHRATASTSSATLTGEDGSLARIVRIDPRATLLRRSADDTDEVERVIVANADQMLIVVAAANPEPRPALIDRYLVAAFDAGIDPMLLRHQDRPRRPDRASSRSSPPSTCRSSRAAMRHPTSPRSAPRCSGRTTVAVGHSGVGKSTLVNALVPEAQRATGDVNAVTGRGRHTSSSSIALRLYATDEERAAGLPAAGWVIDTPGIRSFGLGHVDPANILRSFAARSRPIEDPPDGIALADAHDWEIVDRVSAGELGDGGPRRLESLQRLLDAQGGRVTGADDEPDSPADPIPVV